MTKLYSWTAWRDGDSIKIAGLNEDGFRIPALDFAKSEFLLLAENAHPELPGHTAELCKLLSKLEKEAQTEATEMVQQVAHNMRLSGKPTSAASQQLQIAQLTAELLQEKLISKKERK